ncbi:glutamate-rich WD repeat-containing protein 1 [Tanacetum coccineum]
MWYQEPRSTYMVQTNSGYKASGEPVTVLQQHRRPPQANETTSTMTNIDEQLFGQDDLATKVEAKIDIPTYDGTIDAEKLDSWLDQLETYFTLYGFHSNDKLQRKSLDTHVECDEKEELFTMKIQVKREVIEAIVDTGSQKNLISPSLEQNLGLKTTPHPSPYSFSWIKNDMDTQVSEQCHFRRVLQNNFVFVSSPVDKTIAVWDTRLKKSPVASVKAHDADVNVISWNRLASCMLASGSDDGAFSIRDLRMLKEGDVVVAHFTYHKHAITSIEWSPHEASTLAVSSDDNQLTLPTFLDIDGITAADGFNIFVPSNIESNLPANTAAA